MKLKRKPSRKSPEKYPVSLSFFENVQNPISAYLLGLLWSDGHVCCSEDPRRKNSRQRDDIKFGSTFPDADEFLTYFNFSGKWRTHIKKPRKEHWKTEAEIATGNCHLSKFLYSLGFCNKNDGFDEVFSHIPPQYIRFFMLGVSDGDGCFHIGENKKRSYGYSITSELTQNWNSIENLLSTLGIKYRIERTNHVKHGKYSKIRISSKYDIVKLGDFMYAGHDIGLIRKKLKYLSIKERCSARHYTEKFKKNRQKALIS